MAFVMAVISGTIMSIIVVDAQSTVDDSASCESSTLSEAVKVIKKGFHDTQHIREDVKNFVRSKEQQNNLTCISKKDLEEVKTACASNQQQSNTMDVSSLCVC